MNSFHTRCRRRRLPSFPPPFSSPLESPPPTPSTVGSFPPSAFALAARPGTAPRRTNPNRIPRITRTISFSFLERLRLGGRRSPHSSSRKKTKTKKR